MLNIFSGCNSLESIVVGGGVLTIGSHLFEGHTPCKVIWLTNTPPNGYANASGKMNYVSNDLYTGLSNKKVYPFLSSMFEVDGIRYIPVSPSDRTCDAIDCSYLSTTEHIQISETIVNKGVSLTVKEVNPYTCCHNPYIKDVNIGCVGDVGSYAFYGCTSLHKAIVHNKGSIGDCTFSDCIALKTVELGKNVTSIGNSAFANCSTMVSVKLGNSVKTIGENAFYSCTSLPSIQIPKSVTIIYDNVFCGCRKINT